MSRKKRKKQSPAIVSCKKGLACLGLICAVQMLPQTVLADDSAVQVTPADSVAQVNPADSAVQVTPADSAAQVNLADSVAQVTPADSAAQEASFSRPIRQMPLHRTALQNLIKTLRRTALRNMLKPLHRTALQILLKPLRDFPGIRRKRQSRVFRRMTRHLLESKTRRTTSRKCSRAMSMPVQQP